MNLDPESMVEFLRARLDQDGRGHTTARMLREIKAKRAIVAEWDEAMKIPAASETEDATSWRLALEKAIAILAAIYADHPGYRAEWKP